MTPQQLLAQAGCYLCYGGSAADGLELALLQKIAQTGLAPNNARITETGEFRITEASDFRVIQ